MNLECKLLKFSTIISIKMSFTTLHPNKSRSSEIKIIDKLCSIVPSKLLKRLDFYLNIITNWTVQHRNINMINLTITHQIDNFNNPQIMLLMALPSSKLKKQVRQKYRKIILTTIVLSVKLQRQNKLRCTVTNKICICL